MVLWKRGLAITGFFPVPLLVNILNVKYYGAAEFWITLFKIFGIVVLTIVGFVIAAGGTTSLHLGTDSSYQAVACSLNDNAIAPCMSSPGFACRIFFRQDSNR